MSLGQLLLAPFQVTQCRNFPRLLPPARFLLFRATSPWFISNHLYLSIQIIESICFYRLSSRGLFLGQSVLPLSLLHSQLLYSYFKIASVFSFILTFPVASCRCSFGRPSVLFRGTWLAVITPCRFSPLTVCVPASGYANLFPFSLYTPIIRYGLTLYKGGKTSLGVIIIAVTPKPPL